MEGIRHQLEEDIKLIQSEWGYIDKNLEKDEYAFNYWILSRLYSIDEQLIPEQITEYNDKNIDCFVHYEESKELYIIQNKFYSEDTQLDRKDASDFIITPLAILEQGNYKRSNELQKVFNYAKKDSDYKIWLHLYVSNNKVKESKDIETIFSEFQYNNPKVNAYVGVELFSLSDIKDKYYGKRYKDIKKFNYTLNTKNKATSLNILPEEFEMPQMLKSHYIMTPVYELYDMYKKAEKESYGLFEENIREFLGTKGINNGIIRTLKDKEERKKFFYYNNGVTIICNESGKENNTVNQYSIRLTNPQVVNGCQTINSIKEVLSSYGSDENIRKEFSDTYVITKVLVFNGKTAHEREFYKDIVKYTNTQNAINEKAFSSNIEYFENMKKEFLKRGYLLSVKPSDDNSYTSEYADKYEFAKLKKISSGNFEFFDLDNSKIKDFIIPLEKLLQVLLAFVEDGYFAFTKKNYVLKRSSKIFEKYSLKFHEHISYDNMIKIYMLYKKAEIEKRESQDKKTPIPYYIIDFIGEGINTQDYEMASKKLSIIFSDKENFNRIYEFIKIITIRYKAEYAKKYSIEYNEMIKKEIDREIVKECIASGLMFSNNDFEELFNCNF